MFSCAWRCLLTFPWICINTKIFTSRFYFEHQVRLPQSQESKKSFSLIPGKGRKSKLTSSLKDNGQICQFLIPDKNTWTLPRPSTIGLPSGAKNVHLLRGEDVHPIWKSNTNVSNFRTCIKSKQNTSEKLWWRLQFLVILRRKFSN